MRLTDLHPEFCGAGGEGISNPDGSPAPERHGVGLLFDCPLPCESRCYVAFANPLDGGPPYINPNQSTWQRTGETFETLTLTPSIFRDPAKGGCGWHGFVTAGEVTTC